MILKIIAYQHQSDLLPEKWEIEHIFPLQILKSKNCLNILEIKFPLKRGSILSQATDTLLRKKKATGNPKLVYYSKLQQLGT